MRVLLLNMPWISLGRPAIGVSLLKAALREQGVDCRVGYGNLLLAARVGKDDYELVCERISSAFFAGDWLTVPANGSIQCTYSAARCRNSSALVNSAGLTTRTKMPNRMCPCEGR